MKKLNQKKLLLIFVLLFMGSFFGFQPFSGLNYQNIVLPSDIDRFKDSNYETKTFFEIITGSQPNTTLLGSQNLQLNQGGRDILRNSDISNDFVVDTANNIVTIGTINDEDGSRTAYISKIDIFGELIWNKTIDGVNQATQVALGQDNNLFFIGNVQDGTSFTVSPNAINTTTNGFDDNILIQFNPNGDILWSTYWGGSDIDSASGIAIDEDENIIISGETQSANFPVTVGAVDQIKETDRFSSEFYITKFTKEGNLVFSTFFGGNQDISGSKLAVDSDNNIILTGIDGSNNFPTTSGAYQLENSGNNDIVLFKLNPAGALVFSTYFGGSLSETPNSISIDNLGNIYLTGKTLSSDFPLKNAVFDTIQGKVDMFIVKFDKNGELLISSYYGYSDNDEGISIHIAPNNDVLLTGITRSDNLPTTQNSYQTSLADKDDAFLMVLDSSFHLKWTTYLGGLEEDGGYTIKDDLEGNIIVLGRTESEDFPIFGGYQYTFGGLDGFLAKFSSIGVPIWVSRTTIITDPDLDLDSDTLTNSQEFSLKTNPLSADTDGDGMNDGWESANGLDPLVDDRNDDPDLDGFTNKQESQILTDPFNSDTDGDNMTDGWEFLNQLDPLDSSDFDNDRDEDGMPALWEFIMGLSPIIDDGSIDIDSDGLDNFVEWNFTRTYSDGLNPNNPDTDGDGMNDGWEVKNGINPLDPKDAKYDPDNDFLINEIEYKYRNWGMDPNDRKELYILISITILVLIGLSWLIFRIRQSNRQSIEEGYMGYLDRRAAKKAGFTSADNRNLALKNGFITKEIYDIVRVTGIFNVKEMFDNFKSEIEDIKLLLSKFEVMSMVDEINVTTSPLHVTQVQTTHQPIINKLNDFQPQLSSSIALQDVQLKLFERSNKELLIGYTQQNLQNTRNEASNMLSIINNKLNIIEVAISGRLEWFGPWTALLRLIQITQPQIPINITEIMEVIYQSEEHSEELLILLLQENSHIGTYDKERKIYVKGVQASSYLEQALRELEEFEESV